MLVNENITIIVAFLAGISSFLMPCILPMVPIYIMYLTGNIDENKSKISTIYRALGFVSGFIIIFVLMGMTATIIGQVLVKYKTIIIKISGVVIIIFGIFMTGIFKKLKFKQFNIKGPQNVNGFFSAMLMGLAFGAGWTPCFAPILGSIVALAATSETFVKGVILLLVYSLGLAIPFLLTAIFINVFERHISKIQKFTKYLPLISGIIIIIYGILLLTNTMSKITNLFV